MEKRVTEENVSSDQDGKREHRIHRREIVENKTKEKGPSNTECREGSGEKD